jgi:hypothetical protein
MSRIRIRNIEPERLQVLTQQLSQTPAFKAMCARYDRAIAQQRQEQKDKYENHPDVIAWRNMTKEARAKDAIDRMTKVKKDMDELRTGKDVSDAEARDYAVGLAEKSDKQKQ